MKKRQVLVCVCALAVVTVVFVAGVGSSAAAGGDTTPPSAPGSLGTTLVSQTVIGIGWAASSDNVGVAGYDVYLGGARMATTQAVSASVGGLTCGTTYTLGVDAYDAAGNQSAITTLSVTTASCAAPAAAPGDATPPSAPGSLGTTLVSQAVIGIGWAASSDNVGVAGYDVYLGGARVATTQAVSASVGGLTCGTTYTLGVDAYDAAGNHSPVTTLSVATAACASSGDTTPPSAPGALRTTLVSQTVIGIGWAASSDNVGVAGYDVYQGGARMATTQAVSASVGGLTCGTTYTLGVDAYDAAGNHSPVTTLSVATAACASSGDTTPPSAPTSLRASTVAQTSIGIGWNASSDNVGVTGYDVYQGGTRVTTTQAVSASVGGLTCGTTYTLGVDAYDAAGNHSAITTLSVATAACASSGDTTPPSAPGALRTTLVSQTVIGIGWAASSDNVGVAGYDVYQGGARMATTQAVSASVGGLTCGTTYTLGVDAYDAAGNHSAIMTLSVATAACASSGDTTPPSAPTSLRASTVAQTSIGIGWNASSDNVGVTGYDVYQGGTRVTTTQAVSASVGGLTCGTTYTLGVDAYDAAGNHSAITTLSVTTSPCSSPGGSSGNPVPAPASGAYFGAYVEGVQTFGYYYPSEAPWGNAPWDTRTWDRFERDAGKRVAMLMFGQPVFWDDPFNYDGAFDATAARGAIPSVDMTTGSTPLTDIANGVYDTQITAWAKAAAAWHKPFVLRLDAEMNGAWYNYGAQARSNPQSFVAMWRHVHDLFVAAGATNVSWHWCPNVDPESVQTPLESLYPGDAYVDWTGMTGYDMGNESFSWLFTSTYARLVALAPSKPIMIGEIGSVDAGYPGVKTQFLSDMFAQLPTQFPQVRGFVWFNWRTNEKDPPLDWPIESSAAAQAAFQQGIQSSYYVGR